jgi:hypothetical protein
MGGWGRQVERYEEGECKCYDVSVAWAGRVWRTECEAGENNKRSRE